MKKAKKRQKKEKLSYVNSDKMRPRHVASRIISLSSKEAMNLELEKLDEPWKAWVKEYVDDYFAKTRGET